VNFHISFFRSHIQKQMKHSFRGSCVVSRFISIRLCVFAQCYPVRTVLRLVRVREEFRTSGVAGKGVV
jgi:hypothetical protein